MLVPKPSKAGRWVNCPGSVKIESLYKKPYDSQSALEGLASHAIAEEMIKSYARGSLGFPKKDKLIGSERFNVVIDEEIYDNALYYANIVNGTMKALNNYNPHVEVKLHLDNVVIQGQKGLVDCYLYDNRSKTLYIFDYKYGRIPVDAFENWQMINYAAGIIDKRKDCKFIVFSIVQPRARFIEGYHKTWTITTEKYLSYLGILIKAAHETQKDNPECRTGKWCNYCDGLVFCAAAAVSSYKVLEHLDNLKQAEIKCDNIGDELDLLSRAEEIIKQRKSALESQIEHYLKTGNNVEGYTLVAKESALKWSGDMNIVTKMCRGFMVDIKKPQEYLTPTQTIKAGVPKEILQNYMRRFNCGEKIEKVNIKKYEKIFKQKG